jgi:hypothetical protein
MNSIWELLIAWAIVCAAVTVFDVVAQWTEHARRRGRKRWT